MDGGVVGPLGEGQIPEPLAGFLMNISSEILFEGAVDDLGLPIRLRMVRRAHTQLSSTKTEKLPPEMTEEEGVSIGHQAPRKAVMFTHHINETKRNLVSRVLCWKGAEMSPLGVTVNYNQYNRVTVRWREAENEIQ